MFPFERYKLVLKKYARKCSIPKGCIAKGYEIEEVIDFCVDYNDDIVSHILNGYDVEYNSLVKWVLGMTDLISLDDSMCVFSLRKHVWSHNRMSMIYFRWWQTLLHMVMAVALSMKIVVVLMVVVEVKEVVGFWPWWYQ